LLKLIPADLKSPQVSLTQLSVIVLSFLPFIEGLQSGQNHGITLLIVTGIIFFMMKEKWYLSGALAGLLIYKPQFVIGFIILWLMWGKFRPLLVFGAVSLGWISLYILGNGLDQFNVYFHLSQVYMKLPYIPGFPNYLLVTLYGLLTSFFTQNTQPALALISQAVFILAGLGLAWFASKLRKHGMRERIPALICALIFPLLATPYALLHDTVILIPAFILWAVYSYSRKLLICAASVYIGTFFLTPLSALTKIAWVSLLIVGLAITLIWWILANRHSLFEAHG
jgi:hypothetical protein